MKRAILTVGLGFGDEGKGATVDYLARRYDADLVVRYCGGSQAGHNVQLPDGRRHTFAQFGAGSLAPQRPRSFLGPNVTIDPPALIRESKHLTELGVSSPLDLLTVHPRCLVTTPWLKRLNQARELARGGARHGSCGQGIGEARHYWLQYGEDSVFAADLRKPHDLRHKLELQRQRTLITLQNIMERVDAATMQSLEVGTLTAEETAAEMLAASDGIRLDAEIPSYKTAIFEGAQGVLLDEYRGFHPHTTWATVTPHHAWELIHQSDAEAVCVLGVTRTYLTRHGEGPLPTFSSRLTARLLDPGNPWNRWQGNIRCGWLDLPLLRYAAAAVGPLDGLAVNHIDQVFDGFQLCEEYRDLPLTPSASPDLANQTRMGEELAGAKVVLSTAIQNRILIALASIAPTSVIGLGPTHQDRTDDDLSFRSRRESGKR